MSTKVQMKTTYEAAATVEPIYTGGDVSGNANGTLIATIVDEDVTVVDILTGKPRCRIDGDGEAVTSVALSPDARHLAVCSRSLSMRIFELKLDDDTTTGTSDALRTLKPHNTPVVCSIIDGTGSLLATGGADGSVKVWDIKGGFITHAFHPHGGVVSALLFLKSPGSGHRQDKQRRSSQQQRIGILLASGGEDGKIKISSLDTKKTVSTLDSHVSVVTALDYREQDQQLLSASRDRTVILWNAKSWKQESVLPALEVLETAGFLSDGKICYSGGENGVLRLWNTEAGSEITPKQEKRLGIEGIVDTVYLQQSSTLLTFHRDQSIRFHPTSGLESKEQLQSPVPVTKTISGNLDEVIDMACVGMDRSLLALANNTESIKLMSIASEREGKSGDTTTFGAEIGILEGHQDIIICLDVDWSGNWLATGAKDNTARLWQIDAHMSEWRCVARFEGHAESLGAVALPRSPPTNGVGINEPLHHPPAFLLTGSQDKTIKRWDTSKLKIGQIDGEPIAGQRALYTRVAHDKDINALDVSPIAPLFASASQDKTIKIWSLGDGSTTGILRGHKRGVWSVRFSPAGTPALAVGDGNSTSSRGLLVSGSGDRTVKVWSLSTYTCLLTLEGHSNSVLKVIWLPPPANPSDEDHRPHQPKHPIIASASADTLLKLWDPFSPTSSDHLLTTLDNHSDRVWALTSPLSTTNTSGAKSSCAYPLISGAADATITFWADTTTQTAEKLTTAATARIVQDQLLQNHIFNRNYREVITLSLALNHPGRLLKVFQDVVSLPVSEQDAASITGFTAVDDVLGSLDEVQLFQLLERVRDWNTNARTAPVAQRVLNCVLKKYPIGVFVGMLKDRRLKGVKEVFRALEVYSERHYRRLEEVWEEGYLVEYTLREMDEVVGGLGVNGHGHGDVNGEVRNGDVVMS
jgi:U3 small nucleolar RNA-associated protein 13